MRILFVCQLCPWPLRNGTRQRVYYLLRGLALRHQVTAVIPTLSDEEDAAIPEIAACGATVIPVRHGDDFASNRRRYHEWAPLGSRVSALLSRQPPLFAMQQWSDAVAAELTRVRSQGTFDAVWVERAGSAEMARHAGFARFVTDLDAVEAANMRRSLDLRGFYWSKSVHVLEAAKTSRYERRLAGLNGPVVVCKDADRDLFGDKADRVFVVPNCVPEFPAVDRRRAVEGRMLFVGDMQYEPNVDAVLHFYRDILPAIREKCPAAHLVIVGRGHSAAIASVADNKVVIYEGEVAELEPAFDRAALFVVPMRRGGGTRLKVLEALARGITVVSTSIGAEGIDVRKGVDLEIADSAADFAAVCASLLADPARRASLGTSGRDQVASKYNWDVGVAAAERVLRASLPS